MQTGASEVKQAAGAEEKPPDLEAKDDAVESTEEQLVAAIKEVQEALGIIAEPVAGLHVVKRPDEFKDVAGESHHVPAKGLGSGISQFLLGIATELRQGEWKNDPAAQAVADAFEDRGTDNGGVAKEPAEDLSAILVRPEAHTKGAGVHTIEGSGPVLLGIADNPRGSINNAAVDYLVGAFDDAILQEFLGGFVGKNGKATIAAAMDRANDGTPEGRRAALSSLDGHFGSSWAQFRRPIRISYPPPGSE